MNFVELFKDICAYVIFGGAALAMVTLVICIFYAIVSNVGFIKRWRKRRNARYFKLPGDVTQADVAYMHDIIKDMQFNSLSKKSRKFMLDVQKNVAELKEMLEMQEKLKVKELNMKYQK